MAAGAAGTLPHELVLLGILRLPKWLLLSLQRGRVERAGLLLPSDRAGLLLLQHVNCRRLTS